MSRMHLPTLLDLACEESRGPAGISPALAVRLLGCCRAARDEVVQLRAQLAEYREPRHAAWPPAPQEMTANELSHLLHGVVLIDSYDDVWQKTGRMWVGAEWEASSGELSAKSPFRIIYDPAWPAPEAEPSAPAVPELRTWTAAELDALPPSTVLVTGLGEPWLADSRGWSSPTDVRPSAELALRGPLRLLWTAPTIDPESADE